MMKAYAWTKTPQPYGNVVPMGWVAQWGDTAENQANSIASQWANVAPVDRVLIIASPFGIQAHDPSQDGLRDYILTNGHLEQGAKWLRELFQRMALKGLVPARLVQDDERGANFFGISQWVDPTTKKPIPFSKSVAAIFNDPACLAKMPNEVRILKPAMFDEWTATQTGVWAIQQWNIWQHEIDNICLERQAELAKEAFGVDVPISNFGDVHYAPNGYLVSDENGWLGGHTCVGDASPEVYLANFGHKFAAGEGMHFKKDQRWNMFLDAINRVRSCVVNGKKVLPWVSDYDFVGDYSAKDPWLFQQLIYHLAAHGIDTVLAWNPRGDDKASAILAQTLAVANHFLRPYPANLPLALRLQPVSLDADSITTFGVMTKYSDFIDPNHGVPQPLPSPSGEVGPSGGHIPGSGV